MRTNKFKARCEACRTPVEPNAGELKKGSNGRWEVRHLACREKAGVVEIRFSSGATITRNARGICEDAPCCGCCTF